MKYVISISTTNGLTYSREVKLETYGDIAGLGRALVKAVAAGVKAFPDIHEAELATFSIVAEGAKAARPKRGSYRRLEKPAAEAPAKAEAATV